MTSRFVGNGAHRLESNPLEKYFADAWREQNEAQSRFDPCKTTLAYLLSKDGGKTLPETTEREEMIAATIIQWLGSPVGSGFVREVMEKANNSLAEMKRELLKRRAGLDELESRVAYRDKQKEEQQ